MADRTLTMNGVSKLEGWISVHEAKGVRSWTQADQAASEAAAATVAGLLDRVG